MAWLRLKAVAAVLALLAVAAGVAHGFEFHEATVDAIQLGFSNGTLTSRALVRFYLDQIGRLNPLLHAVIEVNPDALRQAKRADAELRSSGHATGSLHGVPVLLKDNIATRDALNTTAGSLALLGSVVRRDAGVVARLRRAGAVVLGKASLSEWANFRQVDAGWSARGGQARNPYVLSSTPCGSSAGSGVAAAANMAAVTLGTETDGSILCPSSFNSVVGIKPTLGLTSRAGVIPITPLQDTVGYPILALPCCTYSKFFFCLGILICMKSGNKMQADVPDGVGRGARVGRHRRLRRARRRGHRSGIQVHPARRVHAVPEERWAQGEENRRPQWLLPRIWTGAAECVQAAPSHDEETWSRGGREAGRRCQFDCSIG
uniref:Uncharacterized protein n=1 Tax=Hordeum vulgare subsp. vulgare TaxID=112509 RepID=A0A287S5K1_HORVV